MACGALFFFDGRKRPILGAIFFGPPFFLKPTSNQKKNEGEVEFCFILLDQWLNFKLFGITYLVGKIEFKLLISGSNG